MIDQRLTCVIPTHNRPQFLQRLLHFYSQFPLPCSFLIADSSPPPAAQQNLAVIDRVHGTLNIAYQHIDAGFYAKCTRALQLVRTPFTVFCADDDVLFANSVQRCLTFLEETPGFSAALGIQACINTLKANSPCHAGASYSFLDPCALNRCRRMAYFPVSTFYGVYRTATLAENFQSVQRSVDTDASYFFAEVLLLHLSVLKGRVQVFSEIFALRQAHAAADRFRPKVFDPRRGAELFQQFSSSLAGLLAQTGISRIQAERLVQQWYGYQLDTRLTEQDRARLSLRRFHRFLLRGWRTVLNLVTRNGIVHHRRIRPADLRGHEQAWETAIRLMTDAPQGMPPDSECRAA